MTELNKNLLCNLRKRLHRLKKIISMPELDQALIMIDELLNPVSAESQLNDDRQVKLLQDSLN
jgi:hypothetical protein